MEIGVICFIVALFGTVAFHVTRFVYLLIKGNVTKYSELGDRTSSIHWATVQLKSTSGVIGAFIFFFPTIFLFLVLTTITLGAIKAFALGLALLFLIAFFNILFAVSAEPLLLRTYNYQSIDNVIAHFNEDKKAYLREAMAQQTFGKIKHPVRRVLLSFTIKVLAASKSA
jgi:hypothetical protein